jgi:hypothetical protein
MWWKGKHLARWKERGHDEPVNGDEDAEKEQDDEEVI